MKAEILTYSRARGAFAGITVNGASIKQDKDGTRILYGKMIPAAQILKGEVAPPEGSHQFMATVRKYANQAEVADASEHRTEGTATASEPHARMLDIFRSAKCNPGKDEGRTGIEQHQGGCDLDRRHGETFRIGSQHRGPRQGGANRKILRRQP